MDIIKLTEELKSLNELATATKQSVVDKRRQQALDAIARYEKTKKLAGIKEPEMKIPNDTPVYLGKAGDLGIEKLPVKTADDSNVEEAWYNYTYNSNDKLPVETPILPATQKDVEGCIEQAIKRDKQLEIEYMASDFRNNEITNRKIFPIKIYTGRELNDIAPLKQGKWGNNTKYLKAFCLLRKEERYFKVSRIRKLTLENKTISRV